jgi:hypothetical protein
VPFAASAKNGEARGWQTTGFEKWGFVHPIISKTMKNKPNSDGDYVVIVVRLPVRLLT